MTKLCKEECVCLEDPVRVQVGLGSRGLSSEQTVELIFAQP